MTIDCVAGIGQNFLRSMSGHGHHKPSAFQERHSLRQNNCGSEELCVLSKSTQLHHQSAQPQCLSSKSLLCSFSSLKTAAPGGQGNYSEIHTVPFLKGLCMCCSLYLNAFPSHKHSASGEFHKLKGLCFAHHSIHSNLAHGRRFFMCLIN